LFALEHDATIPNETKTTIKIKYRNLNITNLPKNSTWIAQTGWPCRINLKPGHFTGLAQRRQSVGYGK
jgi:hypothetical protein